MYALIVSIIVAILTFLFVWRILTPWIVGRMFEKRITAYVDQAIENTKEHILKNLLLYHDEEVLPMQQALKQYPAKFQEIYNELDMLASEGQAPRIVEQKQQFEESPKPAKLKNSVLAQNPNRKPVQTPLSPEGHTIVVGQTGSGKTNTLMIEILSRMQLGHELHLVDTKGELAQILENHIEVYDTSNCTELITRMTQVAKDRMAMFANTGRQLKVPITNIHEFREATGRHIPIITIVVEELIVLTSRIDMSVLQDLYAMGRSSGVYIFALTQLMKADILPREMSVNIKHRVYMGPVDRIAMKCLFTGGIPKHILAEAETHLGPSGHALLYTDNKWSCVKIPLVDREVLSELMQ